MALSNAKFSLGSLGSLGGFPSHWIHLRCPWGLRWRRSAHSRRRSAVPGRTRPWSGRRRRRSCTLASSNALEMGSLRNPTENPMGNSRETHGKWCEIPGFSWKNAVLHWGNMLREDGSTWVFSCHWDGLFLVLICTVSHDISWLSREWLFRQLIWLINIMNNDTILYHVSLYIITMIYCIYIYIYIHTYMDIYIYIYNEYL